jgi:hypothetical protein
MCSFFSEGRRSLMEQIHLFPIYRHSRVGEMRVGGDVDLLEKMRDLFH